MRNYRLIRINVKTRNMTVLDSRMTEFDAWHYSYKLQKLEKKYSQRRYWYLVTDRDDWEAYATEFMYYKLDFVLPSFKD